MKGIIGVSPTVSIMACKALNQELVGLMSNSVKCVQYCAANGAHIMTFSWGTFTYSSTLQKAIADVRSRGILVIASAGNTGNNNDLRPYYPACYDSDNLMAVASSDQQNNLSRFSSYGRNCVDIAAPGEEIVSAFPAYLLCNPRGICDPLPYRPKWGTSQVSQSMKCVIIGRTQSVAVILGHLLKTHCVSLQSVPHVAGAAVLLKAAYPGFTCDVLKNLIIQSATKLPSLQGKCVSEGKLNVAAAFELAELIQ